MRSLFIPFIVVLGLVACGSGDTPPAQEEAPAAETTSEPQRYVSGGVVEAVDLSGGTATIAHRDIPGFMNAMTMAFEVRPPELLEQVKAGMDVDFTLLVEADGTYYIVEIGESAGY
jgi:Cu/Ag efflux protein CusF